MQLLQPQDVWLARVPFKDKQQEKARPVVILDVQNSLARVLILPITSAQPNNKYDVTISDWLSIPLDHFSTVKVSNFVYLPIEKVIKRIGRLTDNDWELMLAKFEQYVSTL